MSIFEAGLGYVYPILVCVVFIAKGTKNMMLKTSLRGIEAKGTKNMMLKASLRGIEAKRIVPKYLVPRAVSHLPETQRAKRTRGPRYTHTHTHIYIYIYI
ncbi:hypothetical protein KIPB_005529 [Kipferlia bialata]|uniref:Uncharacterized protein n=1 Tax=Kipferlia bialata TaxID=797122 RepID=A0A391NLF4_9EUKA|nr:hypothetical protein KIPB_005529 [Kipferlia bialata]|eukprot:g5529.t1